jgi:thiol-disulfide isomerase/thioredoxin
MPQQNSYELTYFRLLKQINMKSFFSFILTMLSMCSFAQSKMKTGMWLGELAMNDRLSIPFQLKVEKEGKKIFVVNGAEEILMVQRTKKDSLFLHFPIQDAEVIFSIEENGQSARGYWINYNKKSPQKIPLTLTWNVERRFPQLLPTKPLESLFDGTWEVTFQLGTKDEEKAIGIFQAGKETEISGTFLTETGDYRFLVGNRSGLSFSMSTFNGSWAMLFEAEMISDTLKGKFYSGISYVSDWIAVRNPAAKLRNEASLTYVINDQKIKTSDMVRLNGKGFSLKPSEDKVTVLQIMGTWCPNCLDEVSFMNQLYKSYAPYGLEIIALAYEVGTDEKQTRKKLKAFKKKIGMEYELVLAGKSSKDLASAQFPMLNGIMSFPTTVIMDREGKVLHVHTGYSGPATGQAHKELTDKIQLEIEMALDVLK